MVVSIMFSDQVQIVAHPQGSTRVYLNAVERHYYCTLSPAWPIVITPHYSIRHERVIVLRHIKYWDLPERRKTHPIWMTSPILVGKWATTTKVLLHHQMKHLLQDILKITISDTERLVSLSVVIPLVANLVELMTTICSNLTIIQKRICKPKIW